MAKAEFHLFGFRPRLAAFVAPASLAIYFGGVHGFFLEAPNLVKRGSHPML